MNETGAFEAALRENPDDRAGWCAFADYLTERGDPRGEFMQVQIALEDEGRTKKEREAHKKREAELLAAHRDEWIGELAPFVSAEDADFCELAVTFTRGWVTHVHFGYLTTDRADALARSPQLRFLGRLDVVYVNYHGDPLAALLAAPQLATVRAFGLGGPAELPAPNDLGSGHVDGSRILDFLARMPRLEELHLAPHSHSAPVAALFAAPMPNLRVLRYDHGNEYPLDVLAANPTLGNLRVLHCHPHAVAGPNAYIGLPQLQAVCRATNLAGLTDLHLRLTDFGDAGAAELVASGALKRLRVLDLRYGSITDAGAAALAACPDLRNLTLLDLTQNELTATGVAALTATGVPLVADNQHGPHVGNPGSTPEYLYYGDAE